MTWQFPTNSKPKNIQGFTLTKSNSYILISPQLKTYSTQLIIERQSLEVIEVQRSKQFSFKQETHSQFISLIIGSIKIFQNQYLVYVPEVYCCRNYFENIVYQIANVQFIPLGLLKDSQEQRDQISNIKQQIKNNFLYGFYFSFTWDLTLNCRQKVKQNLSDLNFNWSHNFHIIFQNISQQWRINLMQGYFGKFNLALKGGIIDYYLISRRNKHMGGTRFCYRGINKQGYCSNFVQTEQILHVNNKIISQTFCRGSTPVFWEQKNVSSKINLIKDQSQTKRAMIKHFKMINETYGRIACINLLDKNKQQHILTTSFEKIFCQIFLNFQQCLRYQYFDINQSQKVQELNSFIQKNVKIIQSFGFNVFNQQQQKILNQQNGIFRVNCLDCLGRSSQLIMKMAFRTIKIIFEQLDILQSNLIFKDIYQQIDSDIKRCHQFTRLFKFIWAQNKDFLSKLYCGIQSKCSNMSSLGNQSFFDQIDLGLCLSKPQIDQIKLQTLNFVVGEIKSTLPHKIKPKQYLNIFIASWNVNNINPFKLNLTKFFKKISISTDLIVFGIQQMVQLSPNNVMNQQNSKTNDWKNLLDSYIRNLPKHFIFVNKQQLVGMWIIIYISSKWQKKIRNVSKDIVRTGMGGKYGNKGATIIKMKIQQTSISFINAHLESGDGKMSQRIKNLKYIHQKAFTQNYQINENKIQNCHYKFLIGDLNFRINMPADQTRLILQQKRHFRQISDHIASQKLLNQLLKKDQLLTYKLNPQAEWFVSSYKQHPITFDPTYKMQLSEFKYSVTKNRTPSWCDRILIWTQKQYNQLFYESINDMFGSDHRPVITQYSISIQKTQNNQIQNVKLQRQLEITSVINLFN